MSLSNMNSMDMDSGDVDFIATSPASPMSSPGRKAPPNIHNFSAKTRSAKWMNEFKVIPRDSGTTFIHGIEFCKSDKEPKYDLYEVDTRYDKQACLKATTKQWDTIIKEARAADNLPKAMKAAQFHNFQKTGLRKDLHQQSAEGSQLPLEEYAMTRNDELRKELNRIRKGENPTPRKKYYELLRYGKRPTSLRVAQPPDRTFRNSKASIRQPRPKSQFSLAKEYHFKVHYMNTADRYYEIPKLISSHDPRSNDLRGSPALILIWGGEKEVQKLTIFEGHEILTSSTAGSFDLDKGPTISFRWCGDIDQTLKLYQGKEILRAPFGSICSISYSAIVQNLLITYLTEDTGEQCEFLIKLSPVGEEAWMILQTCCYQIFVNSGKECNMEPKDFFDKKFAYFAKQQSRQEPAVLAPVNWVPAQPSSASHPRARPTSPDPESPTRRREFVHREIGYAALAERVIIRDSLANARPIEPSNFGQHRIPEWEAEQVAQAAAHTRRLELYMDLNWGYYYA